MIELTVSLDVDCAHQLNELFPKTHPCSRLHGHTYNITIGVLCNYGNNRDRVLVDFGAVKQSVKDKYDHRFLNDIMLIPPTAENLAEDIHSLCEREHGKKDTVFTYVVVAETKTNVARYTPDE